MAIFCLGIFTNISTVVPFKTVQSVVVKQASWDLDIVYRLSKDQHTFTWSGITSDHNAAGTLFKYLQKQCSDNMAVVCSLTDPSYGIRLLLLQKAKTVSLTRLMILLSPPDITLTLLAPHQGSIIKTNFFLRLSRVIASYFLPSKCIVQVHYLAVHTILLA